MQTAIDWLTPFAIGEKKWDYQQIIKYDKSSFYPLLSFAADKYKEPVYLTKANEIKKEKPSIINQLLYKD